MDREWDDSWIVEGVGGGDLLQADSNISQIINHGSTPVSILYPQPPAAPYDPAQEFPLYPQLVVINRVSKAGDLFVSP